MPEDEVGSRRPRGVRRNGKPPARLAEEPLGSRLSRPALPPARGTSLERKKSDSEKLQSFEVLLHY